MIKTAILSIIVFSLSFALAQQAAIHGQTATPNPTSVITNTITPSPTSSTMNNGGTTVPSGAPATGHGE